MQIKQGEQKHSDSNVQFAKFKKRCSEQDDMLKNCHDTISMMR